MNLKAVKSGIDELNLYDARVTNIDCSYFGDELTITFEHFKKNASIKFMGCYKEKFCHDLDYEKLIPSKELKINQIPYFLQDIEIDTYVNKGIEFYFCKINIFPLYLEILCKDIKIVLSE